MGKEGDEVTPKTPLTVKSTRSPNPGEGVIIVSQASSPHPEMAPFQRDQMTAKEFILSAASKIADQPLQNPNPNVWAVLTAISNKARKRPQGINVLLTSEEHHIGRLVKDTRFQIDSTAVSASHCVIYRKYIQDNPSSSQAFVSDTSTNGTYVNWEKLKGSEAEIHHGSILSFSTPPQHELAFAFVFREVIKSGSSVNGAVLKRKAEDYVSENKRLKGIGIGAPEGPICLDDFRSLQRSNTELRKQLENQVLTIDTLRNENRVAIEHHENEIKELKESTAKSFDGQIKELHRNLDVKTIELVEVNKILSEKKHNMHVLNEKLNASVQSCTEAKEIIDRWKH